MWGSDFTSKLESLNTFVLAYATVCSWPKAYGVDYVELFGGSAGVTKIAIRRNLKGGRNFDIVAGCDLHDPQQVSALIRYFAVHKPLVLVMGPPCTPFGPWAEYNKRFNYEGWRRSMDIALPLAILAARLATFQYTQGRYFLVENPWLSKLWYLPCWQTVLKLPGVLFSYIDQCAYGLVTIDDEPTKKPTCFVSNHASLLHYLQRTCKGDHIHTLLAGASGGISRCKFAQAWPPMLCIAIVQGIEKLKLWLQYYVFFPATVSTEPCPACKQHMASDDNRHTRTGACRFPQFTPANWLCPACVEHKHSKHSSHTHITGECRWATAAVRATGTRTRGPHVPIHSVAEAAEDFNEVPVSPPDCLLGFWRAVKDLALITELDSIRSANGWHWIWENTTAALVSTNSRYVRTSEPRFAAADYAIRDAYALFEDHAHDCGNWWQILAQDDALTTVAIGYPVSLLIIVFTSTVLAPPVKIKPDIKSLQPADGPERDDPWIHRYPWASSERASSSNSRAPAAAVPVPPVEVIDEGTGADEPEPDVLNAVVPDNKPVDPPDWSSWDLGRALRALRSGDLPTIVRTLRKLHLRWWHASKLRMRNLLSAAGLPKDVLNAIESVCDTCRICRLWQKPSNRPQATLRLSTEFNQVVQIDLLFVASLTVLHCIDEATRWSGGGVIAGKKPCDILKGLLHFWFRIFGAPTLIISDKEGALLSEDSSIFCERWSVSFRPKAVGQHAQLVERHHEILRQAFHRIRSQAQQENLQLEDADIIAEAFFAKNAMLIVHGQSPYQAVLGRVPAVLREFETPGVSLVDDANGGESSRHATRLRELAIQAIVQGTALERLKRADATKARPSGELHDLHEGDLVDIYRTPKTKDTIGWRGPAKVLSTSNLPHGFIEVEWSGRAMSVRVPDLRRALTYISNLESDNTALEMLRSFARTVNDSVLTFAFVLTPSGWKPSKAAVEHPELLRAGVHVGFNTFGLRAVGVRIGHGVAQLSGMSGMSSTAVLLFYPSGNPEQYRTMASSGSVSLNLKTLFGEDWLNYKFIQFLSCSKETSNKLRDLNPDEPHLGDDPAPDGQYPNPPAQPDVDMPEELPNDEDMDEADDVMPDAPPPPRPPPHYPKYPPRNAVSTGSTRHPANTPVSTGRSTLMPDVPPDVPKQPPPKAKVPAFPKAKVPGTPVRTRSPYPSALNAPGAKSKSKSLAKALQRPPGRPGSSTDVLPMRVVPKGTPAHTVPVPSNGSLNSPSPLPSTHEPVLPVHTGEDEEDSDSDASTIVYDMFSSKVCPCFLTSYEAACSDQDAYCFEHDHCTASSSSTCPCSEIPEDCIEIEFSNDLAPWIENAPVLNPGEVLVVYLSKKGGSKKMMVEKPMDNLTAADVKRDFKLVEAGIRKELASIWELNTFELINRIGASNVCSSRWVHKYKVVDGVRIVKSRLVVRGFEDLASNTDLYASTATRWGQRLICSIAVQKGWRLWMADVSTAFLRSATYVDQAKQTGEPVRQVCVTPPSGSDQYIRELPTCSRYSALWHVMHLLKPLYGLKDAPKAWKTALEKALRECGGSQSHTDKCLWFWFSPVSSRGTRDLELALSTHVDDLKGTGVEAVALKVLAYLTKCFGVLKTVWDNFEHCGIVYSTDATTKSIRLTQDHYAKQLILIDHIALSAMKPSQPLSVDFTAQYLSLLGALSWLTQTRTDIAIYTCALQRAAKSPLQEHAVRLNRVVKWCKRKSFCLVFHKLRSPLRVVVISDAAFRKEDNKGLAMRGALICLGEIFEDHPGGLVHLLEFYARKQRRVTRSTYSAELNAASDAFEFGKLVAMTLAEAVWPYDSIRELLVLEEKGAFPVPVELVIDARSVYDSLVASEIKTPAEVSLVMFLAQLKEAMLAHSLSKLWWCDTRDMAADALNKGAISRAALLELANSGRWILQHKALGFSESRHIPIISSVKLTETVDESNYLALFWVNQLRTENQRID